MRSAIGFLMGLLFGFGLILAGMTSPDKVLAFLDVAGRWDPSLAFVMGGAVLAAFPFFRLAARRARPVAGTRFDSPPTTLIDSRLLAGSALFGIGWGLVGICPGPGLVALAIAPSATVLFVAMMAAGIYLSARLTRTRRP